MNIEAMLGPIPSVEEIQLRVAKSLESVEAVMIVRDNLSAARSILLSFGTPDGMSFAETYSATQTAMIEYRDSGLSDPQCDQDVAWMTARSVEILAAALYTVGMFDE